ncbi:uncharacterized protein BT62DRAFT_909075 [Guyanagaster necrorhizus]|uniref:Uncharacterized protein n=1 Tax=Guyanagaster necrorhizus TaxID=856835 RepID=A0A9P8ANR1_9AGAR|nr:uncharacterized protein BT62DRAFT_909075 [Guyanagaster necrorhizus MCA 3950]KAG7441112.1 hypothetical protein BT62DRAFT_909075 [Guyanagaster necrorhizus MCA 3950]
MIFRVKNDIYAALTKAAIPGTYHWILYFVLTLKEGWKMHTTNDRGDVRTWRYERQMWAGPNSVMAVTFTKIGHVDDDFTVEMLEEYVRGIPMSIPEVDIGKERRFTCRVRFKEAIRRLNSAQLFVNCPDVDALERELTQRASALELGQFGNMMLPYYYITRLAQPWSYV